MMSLSVCAQVIDVLFIYYVDFFLLKKEERKAKNLLSFVRSDKTFFLRWLHSFAHTWIRFKILNHTLRLKNAQQFCYRILILIKRTRIFCISSRTFVFLYVVDVNIIISFFIMSGCMWNFSRFFLVNCSELARL